MTSASAESEGRNEADLETRILSDTLVPNSLSRCTSYGVFRVCLVPPNLRFDFPRTSDRRDW